MVNGDLPVYPYIFFASPCLVRVSLRVQDMAKAEAAIIIAAICARFDMALAPGQVHKRAMNTAYSHPQKQMGIMRPEFPPVPYSASRPQAVAGSVRA